MSHRFWLALALSLASIGLLSQTSSAQVQSHSRGGGDFGFRDKLAVPSAAQKRRGQEGGQQNKDREDFKRGYRDGFKDGYEDGSNRDHKGKSGKDHDIGDSAYERGYSQGYQAGFKKGRGKAPSPDRK